MYTLVGVQVYEPLGEKYRICRGYEVGHEMPVNQCRNHPRIQFQPAIVSIVNRGTSKRTRMARHISRTALQPP